MRKLLIALTLAITVAMSPAQAEQIFPGVTVKTPLLCQQQVHAETMFAKAVEVFPSQHMEIEQAKVKTCRNAPEGKSYFGDVVDVIQSFRVEGGVLKLVAVVDAYNTKDNRVYYTIVFDPYQEEDA